MTYPTEAQLVEMEQRARWLLDGVEGQRTNLDRREAAAEFGKPRVRPTRAEYSAVDTREAIARDVLLLVGLVRQSESGGGGVFSRAGIVEKPSPTLLLKKESLRQ